MRRKVYVTNFENIISSIYATRAGLFDMSEFRDMGIVIYAIRNSDDIFIERDDDKTSVYYVIGEDHPFFNYDAFPSLLHSEWSEKALAKKVGSKAIEATRNLFMKRLKADLEERYMQANEI